MSDTGDRTTAAGGASTAAGGASTAAGGASRVAALLVAPAVTAVGVLVAPHVAVGPGAGAAITFGVAVAAALASLALAAPARLPPRSAAGLAAASAIVLAAVGIAAPASPWIAVLVDAALVAAAHAVGGSIGRRVADPGHLLPACVVAAAADVVSLVHPAGPTHAIAKSERALSVLALQFPVPGTTSAAPVLGLGDLVFVALVLGVAAAHRLSVARAGLAAAGGVAVAGMLSAALETPVPALVTIGAAVVAAMPEARRLRAADRRTAWIAATIAGGFVAGALLQRL